MPSITAIDQQGDEIPVVIDSSSINTSIPNSYGVTITATETTSKETTTGIVVSILNNVSPKITNTSAIIFLQETFVDTTTEKILGKVEAIDLSGVVNFTLTEITTGSDKLLDLGGQVRIGTDGTIYNTSTLLTGGFNTPIFKFKLDTVDASDNIRSLDFDLQFINFVEY
ncbi:hypothetical protein ACXGQW_06840 [Wenyingzhuangia sp. IMCC45533]